jgi:uncharacterized protein YdhG (YjbR/CyaY superfamily)
MTDPDAYLQRQPEPHRRALGELRTAIVSTASDCVETMRRGVPAFLLDGKQLVSIGAARQHVSLYVMYGNTLARLADRLAGLDVSNTVVRFDPTQPIPIDVVTHIVSSRVEEIRNPKRDRDGAARTSAHRTPPRGTGER